MKLNHLDLSVENVAEMREFFIESFGFKRLADKSEKLAILTNKEGFVLVLTQLKSSDPRTYPSQFHIGFMLDTPGAVEEKYEELRGRGLNIKHPPQKNRRGTMFYFHAPGGILIEVSCPN